jgi:hypothetical protein
MCKFGSLDEDSINVIKITFVHLNIKKNIYILHLKTFTAMAFLGIDQEVEFHEIKIHFFMRSKLNLFMRSKFTIIFSQF